MNNLVSFLDYDEIANFSNNNSLMKQEQNLQAFTLYDYPSYFLVNLLFLSKKLVISVSVFIKKMFKD